ncbi:MAG: ATP-binding protein [Chloroflexota bacterium]
MNLPEGIVTFLFSDVEGSTQLLETHPREIGRALARHHELYEAIVQEHNGVIFETVGDAVYAAFGRASDGAAAALSVQQALAAEDWGNVKRIACRISLHTGEVERRGDHYFGPPLFRCARLQSIAYGEQTVVSAMTAGLVHDALPEGAWLRDEGWHRLKDLGESEHVYTLLHPGLRDTFPPLKSLDLRPNNLPLQLSSFVGREAELERLRDAIRGHRLVTITGEGGIGKTRLVLQAAAEPLDEVPDGTFFVDLSAVMDADLVLPTILAALGLRESAERTPLEVLQQFLHPKSLLLVLDNFEQVTDAAPAVTNVLMEAPGVRVVVTSRAPLHLRGEQEFRVEPLATPDGGATDDAVRLFVERALAVDPGLALSEADNAAIGGIVRRLDGLPLAIELAASRVRLFQPRAMLTKLDRRLPLLKGGRRDAPDRHQAMTSAIAWSCDLLSSDDQRLFTQLGVFTGAGDLAAAAAVTEKDEMELIDAVERLVDASLLRLVPDAEPARFGMLETIREFALDRCLRDSPDAIERHARYFAGLVGDSDHVLRSSGQLDRLRLLDDEQPNIRTALAMLREQHDPAWLEMVSDLWRYWRIRAMHDEGTALLETAAAAATGPLRARLLVGLGTMESIEGKGEAARAHLDEAIELADNAEAVGVAAEAVIRGVSSLLDESRFDEGLARATEGVRRAQLLGDDWLYGLAANVRGWVLSVTGAPGTRESFLESRDALRRAGDRITGLHPQMNLILLSLEAGDLVNAEDELARARIEAEETGERIVRASIAEHQTHLLLARGRPAEALQSCQEMARFARAAGDVYYEAVARELTEEITAELAGQEEPAVSGLA